MCAAVSYPGEPVGNARQAAFQGAGSGGIMSGLGAGGDGYPCGMDADEATEPGSPSEAAGSGTPAGRCLMCDRWIDADRMAENPDEVLCIDHRDELIHLRHLPPSPVGTS